MLLEGSMANKQKDELAGSTVIIAVTCQTGINSDKYNTNTDYWAQENIVAGAGVQRDDQHHHQGGGQLELLGEPGHIVQDGI